MKKCSQLNNQTHQFKKCKRLFQGQEKRFQNIFLEHNAKYFNFNYFKKWQLSNSNTKVCFDDEILKLQMHQCECKGIDQTINKQIKNPKPKQMIEKNKNFSKLKCNLIKKMNFFFQFCKWIKREKEMQLLIVMFADKQISKAGKLEKSYRGRSASFKEMSSKKSGLLR